MQRFSFPGIRSLVLALACGLLCTESLAAQSGSPADAPLRPGDRLLIRIWSDSSFADSARVDQTGNVVLPVIGRLPVGGLAAPVAVDSIRSAFSVSLRSTSIEVIPLRRITLSGELHRPGVYYLEPHVTLREAVAVAGGVTDAGSGRRLIVSRGSERLSIEDWERREDEQMYIQSGDVVWVRRQPWIVRNALGAISAASVILSMVLALSR